MRFFRLAPFAAALLFTACASTGGGKEGPAADAKPEVLAQQRWDYLISGETEKAYDYMSAGARSTKPREVWAADMKRRPVHWTKAAVQKSECASETSCKVTVFIEYTAKLPMVAGGEVTSPAVLEEQWIAVDGRWYYVPSDLVQGKGLR